MKNRNSINKSPTNRKNRILNRKIMSGHNSIIINTQNVINRMAVIISSGVISQYIHFPIIVKFFCFINEHEKPPKRTSLLWGFCIRDFELLLFLWFLPQGTFPITTRVFKRFSHLSASVPQGIRRKEQLINYIHNNICFSYIIISF